jgi:hypothetical protein
MAYVMKQRLKVDSVMWTSEQFLNVTQNRLGGIQTKCVLSGIYIFCGVLIVLKNFPLGEFFSSGNRKSLLVHDQMNKVGDWSPCDTSPGGTPPARRFSLILMGTDLLHITIFSPHMFIKNQTVICQLVYSWPYIILRILNLLNDTILSILYIL